MVDPHAARMTQRSSQRGQERRKPAGHQRARRKAGQSPVLSVLIEQVRRRTDREPAQHVALSAPRMTAGRIHANGQIADQPDTHSGLARAILCNAKRAIRQPLQKGVERHVMLVRRGEGRDRCACRIAKFAQASAANRIARVADCPACSASNTRVLRQKIPAISAEAREVCAKRAVASLPVSNVPNNRRSSASFAALAAGQSISGSASSRANSSASPACDHKLRHCCEPNTKMARRAADSGTAGWMANKDRTERDQRGTTHAAG